MIVLVTLLCCAMEGSAWLMTLYACLAQSEQEMDDGTLGAPPRGTCESAATMLFKLRVPTELSKSDSKSVTQSVLLEVLIESKYLNV